MEISAVFIVIIAFNCAYFISVRRKITDLKFELYKTSVRLDKVNKRLDRISKKVMELDQQFGKSWDDNEHRTLLR